MNKSIALFEVSRSSRFRLSVNNGLEMKMNEGHWWNDTGGKAKFWERNLSRWHYARRSETGTRFSKSISASSCLCASARCYYAEKCRIILVVLLKSPRQCPLVLLVKVAWRQARASRIEGGIVLRVMCWWGGGGYTAEEGT